jgi:uncharacterized membrane protein YgcG
MLVALSSALGLAAAAADTGWTIDRFNADIDIGRDARITVSESIDVDFQRLERHGIFRDIPVRYAWPADQHYERVYGLRVQAVRSASGANLTYETSTEGPYYRIKIGDADRTVTGKQTYRITYLVSGALNAFDDHDELFWNVNGGLWGVPTKVVTASVRLPADGLTRIECFQGASGSRTPCQSSMSPQRADFAATGQLPPGQQLTIVSGMRKGLVAEPKPILERKTRGPSEWFETTPSDLGAAAFVLVLGIVAVGWRFYTAGRDQRERETIVAEFEPPDKLRPAQIGLIVDERADPKDVTATIVDLAVRGYLTIAEIPAKGLFAKKDWTLSRTAKDAGDLQPYETMILSGIFAGGVQTQLSALREHFYATLRQTQSELYRDSVRRKWFTGNPELVREVYAVVGVLAVVVAIAGAIGLGLLAGAGLIGAAALVPAGLLVVLAPRMPAKTRDGAELLRRTLGFRRYMEVAETDRQRFAEKENIFAEYLPYAIVFGCVTKWARAFSGISAAAAAGGWYSGSNMAAFNAVALSDNLSSFSGEVSSAIVSTPAASGSSGFSGGGGGGSGGGGGGGGGGSW